MGKNLLGYIFYNKNLLSKLSCGIISSSQIDKAPEPTWLTRIRVIENSADALRVSRSLEMLQKHKAIYEQKHFM